MMNLLLIIPTFLVSVIVVRFTIYAIIRKIEARTRDLRAKSEEAEKLFDLSARLVRKLDADKQPILLEVIGIIPYAVEDGQLAKAVFDKSVDNAEGRETSSVGKLLKTEIESSSEDVQRLFDRIVYTAIMTSSYDLSVRGALLRRAIRAVTNSDHPHIEKAEQLVVRFQPNNGGNNSHSAWSLA